MSVSTLRFLLSYTLTKLTLGIIGGTLRWQSPELMKGDIIELTPGIDVYAFGISCAEILNLGALPWPYTNDDTVRHIVCGVCTESLLSVEEPSELTVIVKMERPPLPPNMPILQGPLSDIIQVSTNLSIARPFHQYIPGSLEP